MQPYPVGSSILSAVRQYENKFASIHSVNEAACMDESTVHRKICVQAQESIPPALVSRSLIVEDTCGFRNAHLDMLITIDRSYYLSMRSAIFKQKSTRPSRHFDVGKVILGAVHHAMSSKQ